MKKVLIYICFFIILLFVVAIIMGKCLIKHISYNQFAASVKYFSVPIEYVYKEFKQNREIFIDDNEINSIEDLINESEYVLKIRVNGEPQFYGNGIINNVKILKVFKGEKDKNIEEGKNLKIYDLISYWSGDYVNYYGGITPLNSKYEYIVFLNKTTAANQKNTYVFSSIKYGKFNISISDTNILTDYIQGSLTVKDIMEYEYVELKCESSGYSSCDKYVADYSKMKEQLFKYIKNK